jgi:hypothetical protein
MWNVDAILRRSVSFLSAVEKVVFCLSCSHRLVSLQIFQMTLLILLKEAVISLLGELREVIRGASFFSRYK